MKKLRAIIILIFAACSLQACRHAITTTEKADTSSEEPDTSATINLVVDKYDTDFATKAADGGMAEVAMGKLAVKNGKSKQVKNFGLMMIKEHGKANDKLVYLMQAKKLVVPPTLDTAAQGMLGKLSKISGDKFDKAYIDMMIADHTNDVKEFTEAIKKVQDADLQKFAVKTLPVLQKHLDAINAIHDSMAQ